MRARKQKYVFSMLEGDGRTIFMPGNNTVNVQYVHSYIIL
jgi:hypothetical protein